MTNQEKINAMLEMQDDANNTVRPDWRQEGICWYRTLWITCGEMIRRTTKEWSDQNRFRDHMAAELVNIWVLIMSWSLQDGEPIQPHDIETYSSGKNSMEMIEMIAECALRGDLLGVAVWFFELLSHESVNMTIDDIYVLYAGTYTLESYQREQGESYSIIWSDGREDRKHLKEIIALRRDSTDFLADVHADLVERYKSNEIKL